eukprot:7340194-Karenia_brevis.AAC.1
MARPFGIIFQLTSSCVPSRKTLAPHAATAHPSRKLRWPRRSRTHAQAWATITNSSWQAQP